MRRVRMCISGMYRGMSTWVYECVGVAWGEREAVGELADCGFHLLDMSHRPPIHKKEKFTLQEPF